MQVLATTLPCRPLVHQSYARADACQIVRRAMATPLWYAVPNGSAQGRQRITRAVRVCRAGADLHLCKAMRLAETPRDVCLSPRINRIREELVRRAELDKFANPFLSGEEKCCLIRDAGRLLHVVGDDHDRVLAL